MLISFRSVSGNNIKKIVKNDYTINSACCFLGQKLKTNPYQVFIFDPFKNSEFIYSNCHIIKYSQLKNNKKLIFFKMEGFDSNENTTIGCSNISLDKMKLPIKNSEKLFSNFKQIKNIGPKERLEYREYALAINVTQKKFQNKNKNVLHIGYDINNFKETVIENINNVNETQLYIDKIKNNSHIDKKKIILNEKYLLFNSSDSNASHMSSLSSEKIKPLHDSSSDEKISIYSDVKKVHDFNKKYNYEEKKIKSPKSAEFSYNKEKSENEKQQININMQPPFKQQNLDEPKKSNLPQKLEKPNDNSLGNNQNKHNKSQKKTQFYNHNDDSINSINKDKEKIKSDETKLINKNLQENPILLKQSKVQKQDELNASVDRKKSKNYSHRRSSSVKNRSSNHQQHHTKELNKTKNNENDQKSSFMKRKTNDNINNYQNQSIQCSLKRYFDFTNNIVILDVPPQNGAPFEMKTNYIFDSNRHYDYQPKKKKISSRHNLHVYQPIQTMNQNPFIQNQQRIPTQTINFTISMFDQFPVFNISNNFQGYVINEPTLFFQPVPMFPYHDEMSKVHDINRIQAPANRRNYINDNQIMNPTPYFNTNNSYINYENSQQNAYQKRSCSCHHKRRNAHKSNYDDFY